MCALRFPKQLNVHTDTTEMDIDKDSRTMFTMICWGYLQVLTKNWQILLHCSDKIFFAKEHYSNNIFVGSVVPHLKIETMPRLHVAKPCHTRNHDQNNAISETMAKTMCAILYLKPCHTVSEVMNKTVSSLK